jgi:hypothetical protein
MSSRFGVNVFWGIVWLSILLGSFFGTLTLLNYLDQKRAEATVRSPEVPATDDIRPNTWKTTGKVTYQTNDNTVSMRGPNYIYVERECLVNRCDVQYIIEIERADAANIGVLFLSAQGSPTSKAVTREISGMKNALAEIKVVTPLGTKKVQAFVYAPTSNDMVVFKKAMVRATPVSP